LNFDAIATIINFGGSFNSINTNGGSIFPVVFSATLNPQDADSVVMGLATEGGKRWMRDRQG
jgi:hypothetical protein